MASPSTSDNAAPVRPVSIFENYNGGTVWRGHLGSVCRRSRLHELRMPVSSWEFTLVRHPKQLPTRGIGVMVCPKWLNYEKHLRQPRKVVFVTSDGKVLVGRLYPTSQEAHHDGYTITYNTHGDWYMYEGNTIDRLVNPKCLLGT